MPFRNYLILRSAPAARVSKDAPKLMQRIAAPPAVRALVLLLVLGTLAGCGKKNMPNPPKDEPNTYPRTYPSE